MENNQMQLQQSQQNGFIAGENQKNSKTPVVVAWVCVVLAIFGIGFGAYGLVKSNDADKKLDEAINNNTNNDTYTTIDNNDVVSCSSQSTNSFENYAIEQLLSKYMYKDYFEIYKNTGMTEDVKNALVVANLGLANTDVFLGDSLYIGSDALSKSYQNLFSGTMEEKDFSLAKTLDASLGGNGYYTINVYGRSGLSGVWGIYDYEVGDLSAKITVASCSELSFDIDNNNQAYNIPANCALPDGSSITYEHGSMWNFLQDDDFIEENGANMAKYDFNFVLNSDNNFVLDSFEAQ